MAQVSSGPGASAPSEAYAHTRENEPPSRWEPLAHHLEKTARLAARHAGAFGSAAWGELAGWWHDVGKYHPAFQAYLRGSRERAPHAACGAALAFSAGEAGLPLAFAIAGHHAGLANHRAQNGTDPLPLVERLTEGRRTLAGLGDAVPPDLLRRPLPPLPGFLSLAARTRAEAEQARRRLELWTRFLFSALVDADFLATEDFYQPGKRPPADSADSIAALRERLDAYLAGFAADSPVNELRARVLADCRAAATNEPGLFSLTVPTGGGKTLSAMAFALLHAELHGLRRVIVVIPYTSIIEQNAAIYRDILGDFNVVEHHSAVDEVRRMEANSEAEVRRRLAAENWDAPVVVTTNVQFFESLFASRPSRCRKLHNVARSVVILDEAQSLPAGFLNCSLELMRELAGAYGCSLVLSTATQPALAQRETLPGGLEGVREIASEPAALAAALKRVSARWPAPGGEPTPYATVAEELERHPRVLAIVHLRRDARELAQLLPEEGRFHLSALMCPEHRSAVLKRVRQRLEESGPCRLVATQLVEAGVDVDFPVVYRALAGLDSLTQAAGRCNREGRLGPGGGELVVFRAETTPPPGMLRMGLETAESMLVELGGAMDLADADVLERYFRNLYRKIDTDREGVQTERAQLNFATVAERVKLIEDGWQRPVAVPWGDGAERAEAFIRNPGRDTQRALQRFLVQIPERELWALRSAAAVEEAPGGLHVLTPQFHHLYHPDFGLILEEEPQPAVEQLMVMR